MKALTRQRLLVSLFTIAVFCVSACAPPKEANAPVTTTASVAVMAGSDGAAPAAGQPFPRFSTSDLEGTARTERDLAGRLTLLVVVTSPSASDRLDAWMQTTQASFPDTVVRRVVLLAFDLLFFVPTVVVRDKARAKVPRQYWRDTMLDVHGELAGQVGLPTGDDKPYVFVLDKDSSVRVAVHGELNAKTREVVWTALREGG